MGRGTLNAFQTFPTQRFPTGGKNRLKQKPEGIKLQHDDNDDNNNLQIMNILLILQVDKSEPTRAPCLPSEYQVTSQTTTTMTYC